jgi:hypothetical protein
MAPRVVSIPMSRQIARTARRGRHRTGQWRRHGADDRVHRSDLAERHRACRPGRAMRNAMDEQLKKGLGDLIKR